MVALVYINNYTMDYVQYFTLLDAGQLEYHPMKDLYMQLKTVNTIRGLLKQYLRMVSIKHTSNMIKFDSYSQSPMVHEKNDCRGQIEVIKRLVNYIYLSMEQKTIVT